MMQKAVNIKVKASLRFSTIVWDLDAYCSRSYRLSYNTFLKVQTQDSNNKDFFCFKKLKPKDPKPAPSYNNVAVELAKKDDKKSKKKKFQG